MLPCTNAMLSNDPEFQERAFQRQLPSKYCSQKKDKLRKSRSFHDGYFRKQESKESVGTQALDSAGTVVCSEGAAACSQPLPEERNPRVIFHYF